MEETRTLGMSKERAELISTIIIAIAAILVAWTAFQAGKWGGVQAVSFSEAGAARTESTRFDTLGGQQVQVDIALYTQWIDALFDELERDIGVLDENGQYVQIDGTRSNFLFDRMRPEFRPALEAWLATDPVNNEDAPRTPFTMDEYVVEAQAEADRLAQQADEAAAAARDANQIGDTYTLTTVLFAAVLFFGGVASKLERQLARSLALLAALIFVVVGIITLANLPIELGDEFFFLR